MTSIADVRRGASPTRSRCQKSRWSPTAKCMAGRHEEALKAREEALSLARDRLGPKPRNTLGEMTNLAITYAELGRHDDAIALLEESVPLKRKHLAPGHQFLQIALQHLADCYEKTGREAEARALREEAAGRGEDSGKKE